MKHFRETIKQNSLLTIRCEPKKWAGEKLYGPTDLITITIRHPVRLYSHGEDRDQTDQ